MNDELERDLTAAGGGLLPFAESLRRAPAAHAAPGFAENVMAKVRRRKRLTWLRPVAFATAASAAAAVALTAVVDTSAGKPSEEVLMAHQRADGSFTASSAAPHVQAFAVSALARKGKPAFHALQLAVNALIRSQGADGGWGSAGLLARIAIPAHTRHRGNVRRRLLPRSKRCPCANRNIAGRRPHAQRRAGEPTVRNANAGRNSCRHDDGSSRARSLPSRVACVWQQRFMRMVRPARRTRVRKR